MSAFFSLQPLDVLTTLIGLHMGAHEASFFVGRLLAIGPVAGLLISKCFAIILAAAALAFHRPRVVVFLNYWFVLIVCWNLFTILSTLMVVPDVAAPLVGHAFSLSARAELARPRDRWNTC